MFTNNWDTANSVKSQLFAVILRFLWINTQSKEYKYNRQAFDQKARSMTEKYARTGASEDDGIHKLHSHPTLDTVLLCFALSNFCDFDTYF